MYACKYVGKPIGMEFPLRYVEQITLNDDVLEWMREMIAKYTSKEWCELRDEDLELGHSLPSSQTPDSDRADGSDSWERLSSIAPDSPEAA